MAFYDITTRSKEELDRFDFWWENGFYPAHGEDKKGTWKTLTQIAYIEGYRQGKTENQSSNKKDNDNVEGY